MHCSTSRFWALEHRCGGRHVRRHGLGGLFGAMAGSRGFGWHGFRAGRKLGGDDLQLVILALLAEKPSHGYEIIKALEERSGGFYAPSPGMVYPALTYLEELGYASVEAEGAKKLYCISEEGRAYLEQNRRSVDAIFAQLEWVGAKMEHVRRAFSGEASRSGAGSTVDWRLIGLEPFPATGRSEEAGCRVPPRAWRVVGASRPLRELCQLVPVRRLPCDGRCGS